MFKNLSQLFFLGIIFSFPVRAHATNPVVIIDAGHGGSGKQEVLDESRWNGASFRSKTTGQLFLEKDLTLEMAVWITEEINRSGKVTALTTRVTDVNVGMTDRAQVGLANNAAAFISIHFNSTPNAKGSVSSIQSVKHGNTEKQHAADEELGLKLARAVEKVTNLIDSGSRARNTQDYDVKPEGSHLLGNLRSDSRGKEMFACFLEIEFLDNPRVAKWLVENKEAKATRMKIAQSIAEVIIAQFAAKN